MATGMQTMALSGKVSTALVIALAGLVLAGGVFVWWQYIQTYHLETVQSGVLYRDGNRGMREFENMVRQVKPKTIVLLIDDKELADPAKAQFAQEMEFLKNKNIQAKRIVVKLGGWPDTKDVQHFLDITNDAQNHPVVVHCAQGVRRTGMFVAAYQTSVMGWDADKTKSQMLTFGHSQRTVKDVERFIGAYDAKTKTVTQTFEASSEE